MKSRLGSWQKPPKVALLSDSEEARSRFRGEASVKPGSPERAFSEASLKAPVMTLGYDVRIHCQCAIKTVRQNASSTTEVWRRV